MTADPIAAARELAALLENAKPIPLVKGQVRIDKEEAVDYIDLLLALAEPDLRSIVEEVDRELRNARQVPLTDNVRVARDRTEALAKRLRAAAGSA